MNTSTSRIWAVVPLAAVLPFLLGESGAALEGKETGYAEIRVLDAETGRGVPLVELETVNGLRFVTDNAGRVAVNEPGWLGRAIFFKVKSHGYDVPKDRFGMQGVRVTLKIGQPAEIKIKRRNLAERLCRLTGEGRYRDSKLLGREVPAESPHPGRVAGQDSVQAAIYKGRVYWFWGDTSRMSYPLGLFRMAGATTSIPDPDNPKSDPAAGIPFDYFVDKTGFARAMMPLEERPKGVVWVESVFTVPDAKGVEKLVGHYSRRKGLGEEYEQGIAVFNDNKQIFEPAKQLPLTEKWRHPAGPPIVFKEKGKRWLLFGSPNPNVRVPARLPDVLEPDAYEAFTCASSDDPREPMLDDDGKPVWRWQKKLPPVASKTEFDWIKAGKLKPEFARFCPIDANQPDERILLHRGSVRWNKQRQRWILIACQIGGKPSFLGEVWYAEAKEPTGPFQKAVRIVTHDRQTMYNVVQHPFLDRDDGRLIHFEGTYTNNFSGNPDRTPRYDYNQILYRLDVDEPRLKPARVE